MELALEYFEEKKPNAVLVNHKVGKENGLDIINTLREKGFEGFIGLLAGHEDEKLIAEAIKAGADDFIKKEKFSSQTVKQITSHFFKTNESEMQ